MLQTHLKHKLCDNLNFFFIIGQVDIYWIFKNPIHIYLNGLDVKSIFIFKKNRFKI